MRGMTAGREAVAAGNDSSSPPGGPQLSGSESGEHDLEIIVGPSFALRAQLGKDIANQKAPGANTAELIFAPAASAVVVLTEGTNETGEDAGVPLANVGYDPNEPRIPAGQPGGGQWTAGAGGAQNTTAQAKMVPSRVPSLDGIDWRWADQRQIWLLTVLPEGVAFS
jgi:hypothetical protein